jgi:hypothetical protein
MKSFEENFIERQLPTHHLLGTGQGQKDILWSCVLGS